MPNTIQKATSAAAPAKREGRTMQDLIKVMQPEIEKALPSVLTPERFTRMVLSALSTNPNLANCTPRSFLGAMMSAAQLGVEPNTSLGQAYLIPYRNHGTLECQFQLGYKGLIDLAYRSGEVSTIQAHEVCENDEFSFEFGLEPKLRHVPAAKDRGEVIYYYAAFRTKDGGYGFEVMSKADIVKFAQKASRAYNNGPWQTNFDEMAKKTVIKKVLKYAPLKSEFAHQVAQDETIKSHITEDMYEAPDETIYADYEVQDAAAVDASTGEVANNA